MQVTPIRVDKHERRPMESSSAASRPVGRKQGRMEVMKRLRPAGSDASDSH
jgi:hypothetical protein